MANFHHKSPVPPNTASCPEPGAASGPADITGLLASLEQFLARCRRPAVLEPGEQPLVLTPDNYSFEIASDRLWLEVRDTHRSLSRRILSARIASPGVLDCAVHRFANKPGTLTLLDLDRPQTASRTIRGGRQAFAEQFRRMLGRQFPGWHIERLSSAPDLQRSFSAAFPRAWLQRGGRYIAALACADPAAESALLSSALLWHDYVLQLAGNPGPVSLCLFLPEGAGSLTAHRLRWLTGRLICPRLFLHNSDGMAGEVDPADLGNIQTGVASRYHPPEVPSRFRPLLASLAELPDISFCPQLDGHLSIRFRGLEFAQIENSRLLLGIEAKQEIAPELCCQVEQFARQMAQLTDGAAGVGPRLPELPERWFEGAVRSNLSLIAPELLPAPVHGQVLTFAGQERELIDLLAVSASGDLSILELKTAEDIQLPLQALDYWIRIGWHAALRELDPLFPAIALAGSAPKLLLVAPAMSFHPSNQIVLRYFSPEIRVQRIGICSEWQRKLKVVFRLAGAEPPISHRSPT